MEGQKELLNRHSSIELLRMNGLKRGNGVGIVSMNGIPKRSIPGHKVLFCRKEEGQIVSAITGKLLGSRIKVLGDGIAEIDDNGGIFVNLDGTKVPLVVPLKKRRYINDKIVQVVQRVVDSFLSKNHVHSQERYEIDSEIYAKIVD